MLPGEWRRCMTCKGKLHGALGGKCEEYECRACHQELPEDRFDAEKLKMWTQHRNYERTLCLQCTPSCAISWWEKRADGGKYPCSASAEELSQVAYSKDNFCKKEGRVCIECDRAQVVQKKQVEKK